eukprot:6199937-Pleurochrysis_carterae.AAC.2
MQHHAAVQLTSLCYIPYFTRGSAAPAPPCVGRVATATSTSSSRRGRRAVAARRRAESGHILTCVCDRASHHGFAHTHNIGEHQAQVAP